MRPAPALARAQRPHTHTCRRYRTLATPSASLARPLRPSLDHDAMPRAAQRTARVARPFIGPPSSLAARPAATSKVAMDGAANELLGPKGRREIAASASASPEKLRPSLPLSPRSPPLLLRPLREPHPGCRGSRARPGGGAPRRKKKKARHSHFPGSLWTQNAIFGALELQK